MIPEKKTHAVLSASGAHRWLVCTASAMLEQQFDDNGSDAASEGTLAHELAEIKLRHYFFTTTFNKHKLNAGIKKIKEDIYWNDEMDGYTDVYLEYIRKKALELKKNPYVDIEKRVDFSAWVPGGFGTADCVMIYDDTIYVFDFKYGKGVPVSAENNPQMMLYALGVWDAYRMIYPINRVVMTIIQPRISDEPSEWDCSVSDLLQFGDMAKQKAVEALSGKGKFMPEEKACKFCRARYTCRARANRNVEIAFASNTKPELLSDDEIGDYISKGEDVAKWLKDIQEYALKQCLSGKSIPGYKAVEGRSTREWTDMAKAFETIEKNGFEKEMLWERKPLTLAQVEKLMGAKKFASCVGDMVIKLPGKPTLVKESDKRIAINNIITAEMAFNRED